MISATSARVKCTVTKTGSRATGIGNGGRRQCGDRKSAAATAAAVSAELERLFVYFDKSSCTPAETM